MEYLWNIFVILIIIFRSGVEVVWGVWCGMCILYGYLVV